MTHRQRKTNKELVEQTERLQQRIAALEGLATARSEAESAGREDRQSLNRILELHEHDRQLIAYEIHDGFTQQATAALLQLQAFQEAMRHDSDEAWERFHAAVELLRLSINESRRLINGLRPLWPAELGLKDAINGLIAETRSANVPVVNLCWQVGLDNLPPGLAQAVFRVVQECLTNARKHSKSSRAEVRVTQEASRLHLEVKDWGVGFDPGRVPRDCVGLDGIRLRARLLGGIAKIISAPGQGTSVLVEFPLAQATPQEN